MASKKKNNNYKGGKGNKKPTKFGGNGPKGVIKPRIIKGKVPDARQKIVQKKRKSVVDAREILAKRAKSQDARSKINRIRGGVPTKNGNIKIIGSNIVRKTDRNGKISLVTNKTKNSSHLVSAIQKELGLGGAPPRSNLTRIKKATVSTQATPLARTYEESPYVIDTYNPSLYKWTNPAASQLIGSLGRREASDYWPSFSVTRPARVPMAYIDLDAVDDEEMPMVPVRPSISLQGTSRVSNVHSRLDSLPLQPETHGILSHTKTKVVVPAGHRIVVSNLQGSVSQEDIKELFEDIGPLLAARLVRPGVGEVIYKNLKDAQKAVDTYHNRQLDGQPMKCLLVNKRPLNQPTAPPVSKLETQGLLRKSTASNSNNKLVPDLSTIHKVLFQRN